MNLDDPSVAQRVVSEYAAALEQHVREGRFPMSTSGLPYPKEVVRASIRTVLSALAASDQLTDDRCAALATAFVSLADYLDDDDLVRLMDEHRAAGRAVEISGLVASIERTMAEESAALAAEFRLLRAAGRPQSSGGAAEDAAP